MAVFRRKAMAGEPRRDEDERVSLAPLGFEEAVAGLLRVPTPGKSDAGAVVPPDPTPASVEARREGYEATDRAIDAFLSDPAQVADAKTRLAKLERSEAVALERPEDFWERHPRR